jgi:sensor domain CHASE-containing protein
MGVRDMAAINETVITIVTIHPNCSNMTPAILQKVKGKNTAINTKVEAIIESEISLVAKIAADLGFVPRSMWVVIFSITTMASSTTNRWPNLMKIRR